MFYDLFGIFKKYLEGNYFFEDLNVYKIEMLCDDKKGIDYFLFIVNDEYDYIYDEEYGFFELYLKRNIKVLGILKVLDFLDIFIENSYVFGDGKNDIEMLLIVGCGIVMGNVSDYVKKYVKKVIDIVYNDGVVLEIENFILK